MRHHCTSSYSIFRPFSLFYFSCYFPASNQILRTLSFFVVILSFISFISVRRSTNTALPPFLQTLPYAPFLTNPFLHTLSHTSYLTHFSLYHHIISHQGLDSTCYPEILGKMLVINVPFLAIKTWNVVKRWLDPRTLSKIEVSRDCYTAIFICCCC